MTLNTKDLLSDSTEELVTTGLTFHRIRTPNEWGDITTDRSLYGYEVDRNFYNLKAEDIKTAYAEENSIILEKWDGKKFIIDIDKLEELTEEIEKAKESTDELSGKTANFITTVTNDYCTKEEAQEIADEAADEVRDEVKEAKYLTSSDLLTWAYNNLKTINCISLIGKGNIVMDNCGCGCGCGGGGGCVSFQLLAGDAINIVTNQADKSMEINVVVDSGSTQTEESKHDNEKPGKNFLHVANKFGRTWLEVNGVDSDSIYITEDIKLGGTRLGDFAKADSFPDGFIPKGMTLQTVLEKLFWKEVYETWDTLVVQHLLKFTTLGKITVTPYDVNGNKITGNTVSVGSLVKFVVDKTDSSGTQVSKVSEFSNGYMIDGETFYGSTYTVPNVTPSVETDDLVFNVSSNMELVDEETHTYRINEGTATLKVSVTEKLVHDPFEPVTVYDISSKGNTSEEHKAILDDTDPALADITRSLSGTCVLTASSPVYLGFNAVEHNFTEEGVDQGDYILQYSSQSAVTFESEKIIFDVAAGAIEIWVAAPASKVKGMMIKNGLGMDVCKSTINFKVNGVDYIAWVYTASIAFPNATYKITLKQNT